MSFVLTAESDKCSKLTQAYLEYLSNFIIMCSVLDM